MKNIKYCIRLLLVKKKPNFQLKQFLNDRGYKAACTTLDFDAIEQDIKEYQPNVVLFEIDCKTKNPRYFELIKKLTRQGRPKPCVIMYSLIRDEDFIYKNLRCGLQYYIAKPFDHEELAKRIWQVYKVNLTDLDEEYRANGPIPPELLVKSAMAKLGFSNGLRGYEYLFTGILLSVKNPDLCRNIVGGLYQAIADKHNTTVARVERDIRHSITITWRKNKYAFDLLVDYIERIYNEGKYTGTKRIVKNVKPSNSVFIITLACIFEVYNRK